MAGVVLGKGAGQFTKCFARSAFQLPHEIPLPDDLVVSRHLVRCLTMGAGLGAFVLSRPISVFGVWAVPPSRVDRLSRTLVRPLNNFKWKCGWPCMKVGRETG